jgi:hypothetical protein
MTEISSLDASRLATTYYDAMRMVDRRCSFHLPVGTSPRAALDAYLRACERCGVSLHNEHWLRRAEDVVRELTARRRRVVAEVFGA